MFFLRRLQLAKTEGYDLSSITGTGPGGRIIAADVKEYVPAAADASEQVRRNCAAHPDLHVYICRALVPQSAVVDLLGVIAKALCYPVLELVGSTELWCSRRVRLFVRDSPWQQGALLESAAAYPVHHYLQLQSRLTRTVTR